MKFVTLLLSLAFATAAQAAATQYVTCVPKGRNPGQLKITLQFDPSISKKANWTKNYDFNAIQLGNSNRGAETTARVSVYVPSNQFEAPYAGTFELTSFTHVNSENKAGSGYSHNFKNTAYRSFHGATKDDLWDVAVYLPEDVIGKSVSSFRGLTAMQMDLMNEGEFQIDLVCSSVMK